MTVPLPRPATTDSLFLWVLHRFAEEFEDRAILKGGIELRLFDCPRSTTDIDYVFVPFRSKKDVADRMTAVLREIQDAEVVVKTHSKMVRATLRVDAAAIQIEANVDLRCNAQAAPTGAFATGQGQPSRIVRVMELRTALAHKLAAWNERRLLRDLYDAYFLSARLGATPDATVLARRLQAVESRLPRLSARRKMSMRELAAELQAAAASIDDEAIRQQLAPLLPPQELIGLVQRLRSATVRLAENLEHP